MHTFATVYRERFGHQTLVFYTTNVKQVSLYPPHVQNGRPKVHLETKPNSAGTTCHVEIHWDRTEKILYTQNQLDIDFLDCNSFSTNEPSVGTRTTVIENRLHCKIKFQSENFLGDCPHIFSLSAKQTKSRIKPVRWAHFGLTLD